MLYAHAGVLAGEMEQVMDDGFIHHSDETSLPGSWEGLDPESGIQEYLVAIGTTPGIQSIY